MLSTSVLNRWRRSTVQLRGSRTSTSTTRTSGARPHLLLGVRTVLILGIKEGRVATAITIALPLTLHLRLERVEDLPDVGLENRIDVLLRLADDLRAAFSPSYGRMTHSRIMAAYVPRRPTVNSQPSEAGAGARSREPHQAQIAAARGQHNDVQVSVEALPLLGRSRPSAHRCRRDTGIVPGGADEAVDDVGPCVRNESRTSPRTRASPSSSPTQCPL